MLSVLGRRYCLRYSQYHSWHWLGASELFKCMFVLWRAAITRQDRVALQPQVPSVQQVGEERYPDVNRMLHSDGGSPRRYVKSPP